MFLFRSSENLLCNLQSSKITCNDIKQEDLYSNITVIVNPDDVSYLKISNSSISSIDRNMFKHFKYLHTLNLENIQLKNILQASFVDLSALMNLLLHDNLLENFNSDIFDPDNVLKSLDLSNNLIANLDNFNISSFSTLKLMNISNNKLHSLPKEILNKLQTEDDFYLIIDNNPWNCDDTDWIEDLDTNLIAAFCKDFTEDDYVQNDAPTADFVDEPMVQNIDSIKETKSNRNAFSYENKCFSYCTLWFIGGVWLGVILGNAFKIKKLICRPNIRCVQERDTQCGKIYFYTIIKLCLHSSSLYPLNKLPTVQR